MGLISIDISNSRGVSLLKKFNYIIGGIYYEEIFKRFYPC